MQGIKQGCPKNLDTLFIRTEFYLQFLDALLPEAFRD